ncbi:hypothetical protein MTR_7g060230 [Medicago truncatula]|uniref:Uncharacterized protein n=1 Tax=Medicago truncatula TaxID=3880 RepID=G7L3D4_MEDTR|nr:hypothetical protein MTR_7g060230 [Medicago truncatula]
MFLVSRVWPHMFKEEGNREIIYDDEYGPDDIHEVFEKEENDEPIYDEEYLPAEYGESLEVKRILQTKTTKNKLWLGHNFFHAHCTSQDMVCNVIVNNKRCENVASNYIDICHIYLGRPCQYDCRALYDGYANIYPFVKDVIKIKFAPLPLDEFNEGNEDFKPLEILVTKEPFMDKTK